MRSLRGVNRKEFVAEKFGAFGLRFFRVLRPVVGGFVYFGTWLAWRGNYCTLLLSAGGGAQPTAVGRFRKSRAAMYDVVTCRLVFLFLLSGVWAEFRPPQHTGHDF